MMFPFSFGALTLLQPPAPATGEVEGAARASDAVVLCRCLLLDPPSRPASRRTVRACLRGRRISPSFVQLARCRVGVGTEPNFLPRPQLISEFHPGFTGDIALVTILADQLCPLVAMKFGERLGVFRFGMRYALTSLTLSTV